MKKYFSLAVIILVCIGSLFGLRKCNKKQDKAISSTTLAPSDKEKIIVDPVKHTIEVITKDSDKKTYLPDRPTSVTEDKNGNLIVNTRVFGTELKPYAGIGYDGKARLHLGVDGLYYKRFDLGAGLKLNPSEISDTRVDLNLSYNFWSNTSIALSYDNRKSVGCFLKLRF